MKINNIGYLMKEGIRGIFLHGFMSFAAVCVTVACLLIVGSFSCLTYNVSIMVEDLNKTNQIVVYVDDKLSEAEARSLTTPINVLDNVHKTQFVTREQALEDFIANHKDGEIFSDMEASDLRHRIIVVLEDNNRMRETVAAIEKINGVGDISASYALAEGFATIENVLHLTSIVVIAVLLVVSLLIISNTVKLAMFDRRDEIAIMKMVGATNGFIRLPYVVEGFILGMLGAAIAFGLQWLLYDAVLVWLEEMQTLDLFNFVAFEVLLVPMVCIFAAAGLFVGIVGSWTSIRKFLNV